MMTGIVKKATIMATLLIAPGDGVGRLLDEAHADALAVPANDLSAPLDIILVWLKRTSDDNVAPDDEAAFDLDVSTAGTEVFDDAFKELAVGGKMRFDRAGLAGMEPCVAGFAGRALRCSGRFG